MIIPPPSSESARSWCIAFHLVGLLGFLVPVGAPLLVPLVLWLLKRAEDPAIDATGRIVLNFQLSYTIYFAIAGALCFILIGFLFLIPLTIVWAYCQIRAAIRMSNGSLGYYDYPWSIQFLGPCTPSV